MFDQAIDFLNQKRNVSFILSAENIYTAEITVNGEKTKLSIDLGQGFPHVFPTISIIDGKRFMPHSSSGGKLCLFDEASVIIKQDMPEQLLLDSYDRAIEILEMDPELRKEEVFREFFAYWENHVHGGMVIYTNLSVASKHEYQKYTAIGSKLNQLIVSDSIEESKTLLVNHMGCNQDSAEDYKIPCYRIRLRASSLPNMKEEFTWKNIRRIGGETKKQRFSYFRVLQGLREE